MRRLSLEGERFGKITVIKFLGTDAHKHSVWKCQCECGTMLTCTSYNLKRGATTHCGCIRTKRDPSLKFNTFVQDISHPEITFMFDHKGNRALIDTEEVSKLAGRYWYKNKYWYNSSRGVSSALHREVMNPPEGYVVDHVGHDLDDNRKSQLRVCSPQENQYNKKPKSRSIPLPTGIYPTPYGKYRASIRTKEVKKHRNFESLDEAIAQRVTWEKEVFGNYAYSD